MKPCVSVSLWFNFNYFLNHEDAKAPRMHEAMTSVAKLLYSDGF